MGIDYIYPPFEVVRDPARCISCRLCEKACDADAISVDDFVAHIDYSKCTVCGKCSDKCPRKIIKSSDIMSGRA